MARSWRPPVSGTSVVLTVRFAYGHDLLVARLEAGAPRLVTGEPDGELTVFGLGVDDDSTGAAAGIEADLELVGQHDLAGFGACRRALSVERVRPQRTWALGTLRTVAR